VVDALLAAKDAISGEDADLLLDFRKAMQDRSDAEGVLRQFCQLRRRLEFRHYLALYRLRRWLQNQLLAEVSGPSTQPVRIQPRLNGYCVEAIRRLCLCDAMKAGSFLAAPRLQFVFAPAPTSQAFESV